MPYGRMKNSEVVERVQKGIILDKPKACFKEVYDVCFVQFFVLLTHLLFAWFIGNEKVLVPPARKSTIISLSQRYAS